MRRAGTRNTFRFIEREARHTKVREGCARRFLCASQFGIRLFAECREAVMPCAPHGTCLQALQGSAVRCRCAVRSVCSPQSIGLY